MVSLSGLPVSKALWRGEGVQGMSDWPYVHFKRSEFTCNCAGLCNKLDGISRELVEALDTLRGAMGAPMVVTSGLRCPEYNYDVGGSSESRHLYGLAADILIPDGFTTEEFADMAEELPEFSNGGIGLYDSFVHLDVRGRRARWDNRTDGNL
jgi:hypothetical protein